MSKTSNLYVRLDPELKEQAERILEQLGIPMSNAVNIFLKQVVLQRGIPFEVKLTPSKPVSVTGLTNEEMDAELDKGYVDYVSGRTRSAKKSFSDIRKDYKV